ncbi:MAG: T9SS type A sorting domain-containing protein [Thiohalospira sp.]
MKKIILFFVASFLVGNSFGQSISSQVIATAGENSETSELGVSWTLGEIAIETLESSSVTLNQGFQHGYFEITSIEDPMLSNVELEVYPNPATEYIYISIESDEIKSALIELYDLDGKMVLNEQWQYIEAPFKINLEGLASSQYILKVSDKSGALLQTYKIVKR